MATPLNLMLSGGFSMFLAAVLSTIIILLLFERKFLMKHTGLKWTAATLSFVIALYLVISKPSVVPLTATVLVLFFMPLAFVLLIVMFMKGRWVFYHGTQKFISICLAIIAFFAVSYAVGDKLLSFSSKNIVLGTGTAAFEPFSASVLGMALFLTLGVMMVYSVFK